MPTVSEINELYQKCVWNWVKKKCGYEVVGPNGNHIFIPAAGCACGYNHSGGWENYGFLWSSSANENDIDEAFGIRFDKNGNITVGSYTRYFGLPIRPIIE
jgi:hypothetical protein